MTDRAREVLAEIAKSIHPQCPDDMLVIVTSTDGGIVSTRFPVKVGDIRSALRPEASAPQPMAGCKHELLSRCEWRFDHETKIGWYCFACRQSFDTDPRLVPSQPDTGTKWWQMPVDLGLLMSVLLKIGGEMHDQGAILNAIDNARDERISKGKNDDDK